MTVGGSPSLAAESPVQRLGAALGLRVLVARQASTAVDDDSLLRVASDSGALTADVPPLRWREAVHAVRDDLGFAFFDWLSAVDEGAAGIAVVLHVWAPAARQGLLLRTLLPGVEPRVDSVAHVYAGADWCERETFEMFGVVFEGHPGLRPLLLPDGFAGHPLRKDFVLASRVVRPWPGVKEPGGESRRRAQVALGVPEPGAWGPGAGQ